MSSNSSQPISKNELRIGSRMRQLGVDARIALVEKAYPRAQAVYDRVANPLLTVEDLRLAQGVRPISLTLGAGDLTTMPDEWIARGW